MTAHFSHPLTSADIAQQVDELGKTRASLLADQHRRVLDSAEAVTDAPWVLANVQHYRARVAQLERFADVGMLGENGIGPAIADVASQAAFHGFNWRARA